MQNYLSKYPFLFFAGAVYISVFYQEVFIVLGAVPDFISVELSKEQLRETADKILKHLYGPAGLVMQMETRNALIYAWKVCKGFQKDEYNEDQLKDAFYFAGRYIRTDLQLDDIAEIESEWKKRMKKI